MHDHHHPTPGAEHTGRLGAALALVAGLLVVEVAVAVATGSLALLSDAGHLATDLLGLGLALTAIRIVVARRPSDTVTYGWHRLEILAALVNSALLLGIAVYVAVEGLRRVGTPPELAGAPLVAVATLALVVNLVTARLLRSGADVNLNLEGARLEVLADAVGSLGVLLAGGVIWLTGWSGIDTVVALGVAAWVLPRAVRLGGRALRVLLQAAPGDLDLAGLTAQVRALPGVAGVHDLHVWTLTSGVEVASVHVQLDPDADGHEVLHAVEGTLRRDRRDVRCTVQLEPPVHGGCRDRGC